MPQPLPFDAVRVQRFRDALRDGSFRVDAERVADRLIRAARASRRGLSRDSRPPAVPG